MKRLKYLLSFVIALLVVPSIVSAKETIYFKNFKIGDEINVTLSSDEKVKGKFIVIETSPEGEQKNVEKFEKGTEAYEYVTAVYVGNIGESSFGSTAGVTYEKSRARSNLVIKAVNANWDTYEEIRLLTVDDLGRIGAAGSESARTKIYGQAPLWLGENAIGDEASLLRATGIATAPISTKANLVPVIRVHKGWVQGAMICNCEDCLVGEKYCPADPTISIQACIDSGKSENACIMQLCTKPEKVCPKDPSIKIQACIDGGMSEEDCVKKLCNKVCPSDPKISIQSCIDGGKGEAECVKELCPKVCPNDPSMNIQECIDGGMSEEDCVKKLCNKVCPNDSSINIQGCINGGMSEEACIKKLCPGGENVENPKTGAYLTLGLGTILFLVASYLLSTKKNYFSKVK